jgi:hypothetical protein
VKTPHQAGSGTLSGQDRSAANTTPMSARHTAASCRTRRPDVTAAAPSRTNPVRSPTTPRARYGWAPGDVRTPRDHGCCHAGDPFRPGQTGVAGQHAGLGKALRVSTMIVRLPQFAATTRGCLDTRGATRVERKSYPSNQRGKGWSLRWEAARVRSTRRTAGAPAAPGPRAPARCPRSLPPGRPLTVAGSGMRWARSRSSGCSSNADPVRGVGVPFDADGVSIRSVREPEPRASLPHPGMG